MSWPEAKLSDVAEIDRKSIAPSDISTGTLYVGLEHITKGGGFIDVLSVSNGELASNKFLFDEQHILFGKLGPYLSKIARPSFTGICSTDILPIRPKEELDRTYLYYWLRTPKMVGLATTRSSGAILPRLSPKELASFPVPLPPLSEQKRIAAILDQADALRETRRAAIAKLDELLQSVFLDMLGDPVTNPKGWKICSIREFAEVRIGPFGSLLHKHDYVDDGIPLINPSHIVGGEIAPDQSFTVPEEKAESLRNYRLQMGDIVLGRRGEIGRCAVVRESHHGFLCGTGSMFIRPEEGVDADYIQKTISSPSVSFRLESKAKGITMKNLNSSIVEEFDLPLPDIETQLQFSSVKHKIESEKAVHEKMFNSLEFLFSSLQQLAFRGDL